MAKRESSKRESVNRETRLQVRPPIVAVLGHVDHGKTSILDFIRKTRVTAKEAGGITQSIGAYQVEIDGKKITFIDTPGHEAFSKMRARGGSVADLVVLVVAADDGVMPQTEESLEHIRRAGVPFLVAVNKIDLPQANAEKVYDQLEKEGVLVEARGGKIVAVPCSAKTGEGIEVLLEMILLLSEMAELKASPCGLFEGVVIESKIDKAGPLATIIVKNGTLKAGDSIVAEDCQAKVKAMFDEERKGVSEAFPSKPVEVLGFSQVPPLGAKVSKIESLTSQEKSSPKTLISPSQGEEEGKLRILLKVDSVGSLEAFQESLSEQVVLVCGKIGDINESDILLAQTTDALIYGFRVKCSQEVLRLAEQEKVKVKTFEIIYELLEDLEKEILAKQQIEEEPLLGKAEIVAEFPSGKKRIAGCRVIKGKVSKGDHHLFLERDGERLGRFRIISMKHLHEDIRAAQEGTEFGAIFTPDLDFKIGDMLISLKR